MEYNPLRYYWVVWYDEPYPSQEGTCFPQFDFITGKENLYKEIKQARAKSVCLFPFSLQLAAIVNQAAGRMIALSMPLSKYVVHLDNGKRMILRRRNTIKYQMNAANGEITFPPNNRETIYLLGWQATIKGRNMKSILFIYEDGTAEMSEDFNFR